MADGNIEFDVSANTANLERQLKNLRKQAAKVADGISKDTAKGERLLQEEISKTSQKIEERERQKIDSNGKFFWEQPEYQKLTEYMDALRVSGGSALQGDAGTKWQGIQADIQSKQSALDGLNKKITDVETSMNASGNKIGAVFSKLGAAVTSAVSAIGKGLSVIGKSVLKVSTTVGKIAARAFSSLTQKIKGFILQRQQATSTADAIAKSMFRLGNMFKMAFTRIVMSNLRQAIQSSLEGVSKVSGEANAAMASLANTSGYLKNSMSAAIAPLAQMVVPVFNAITNAIVSCINAINQFFAILGGGTTYKVAIKQNKALAGAIGGAGSAAKKAGEEEKKALASFDEINQLNLSKDSDSGGGGGSGSSVGSGFQSRNVDKSLKDMIDSLDWTDLGKYVADKANGVLDIADEWINNTFAPWAEKTAVRLATFINGFVQEFDWEKLGQTVADGLNAVLNAINVFFETVDWVNLGGNLFAGINSMFEQINWDLLGEALASKLNALIDTLYGFFRNATAVFNDGSLVTAAYKWGTDFGEAINSFSDHIHVERLGTTIGMIAKTISDSLKGMNDRIDWDSAKEKLAEGFDNMLNGFRDSNLGKSLSDLLVNISELLAGLDWEELGAEISQLLCDIDWLTILDNLGQVIVGFLAGFFGNLVGNISELFKEYFQPFIEEAGGDVASGIFLGILDALANIGQWIVDNIFTPFMDAFRDAFGIHSPSTVMQEQGGYIMEGLLQGLTDWLQNIIDFFTQLVTNIQTALLTAVTWVKTVFVAGWTIAWNAIKTVTNTVWSAIQQFLASIWNAISSKATEIYEGIKNFISQKWNDISQKTSEIWNSLKETLGKVWDDISSKASEITGNIQNFFTTAYEKITSAWGGFKDFWGGIWEGIADVAKRALNRVIDVMNGLSFDVPDWVPLIGGQHFGLNIPRLATGTVVPPNAGEFAAILGDNRTDTEVVSPLETMKEAMLEALQESGGGQKQIVLKFDGNLAELARILKPELEQEDRRAGVQLVVEG